MTQGPERKVERYLFDQVRALGGRCIKIAPTVAGVPDRMVLLPPGHIHLVELKSPEGRLRPIQRVFHHRAARIGIQIAVLSSTSEVDEWLRRSRVSPSA